MFSLCPRYYYTHNRQTHTAQFMRSWWWWCWCWREHKQRDFPFKLKPIKHTSKNNRFKNYRLTSIRAAGKKKLQKYFILLHFTQCNYIRFYVCLTDCVCVWGRVLNLHKIFPCMKKWMSIKKHHIPMYKRINKVDIWEK